MKRIVKSLIFFSLLSKNLTDPVINWARLVVFGFVLLFILFLLAGLSLKVTLSLMLVALVIFSLLMSRSPSE